MAEHAVIVHFAYEERDLGPLYEMEDELMDAVESTGAGAFDGHELVADETRGLLYLYGPDADELLEAARPVLESAACLEDVVATLRYGPPEKGVEETRVTLDARA